MVNMQSAKIIQGFFQIFIDSVNKTLNKDLDTEICTNIKFAIVTTSKVKDAEALKDTNAIYRIDYVAGKRQGALAVLIPEELIADVSDILTGGSGKDSYKGSLSEIQVNSISKILEKMFKVIEDDFKKYYEHDLVFSAKQSLLLKETPEYKVNSDNIFFDFSIETSLTLLEGKEYKVNILLSFGVLNNLMNDLGLSDEASIQQKTMISALSVEHLANVKIHITAELGKTRVPIKYALELVRGSMVELDTVNNSDIKVFANDVEFAYAQIVAVGEHFGLKITKITSPKERLENL
jgi:flagellar motor switch protein FliN